MRTARLLSVPGEVDLLDLHLAPDGRPTASWIDDGDMIRAVSGLRGGALHSPLDSQEIPNYAAGVGFSHDNEGHTVFAYLSGSPQGPRKLITITSTNGASFTGRRTIASIPRGGEVALYAGGQGSLLAAWTYTSEKHAFTRYLKARRGSLFGGFEPPTQLDRSPFLEDQTSGFIDARGRSVILQQAPASDHRGGYELEAFAAPLGRPFAGPLRIAPSLRDCSLDVAEKADPHPIATSPDGRAILLATCEEGSHQRGRQYVIRYTP